MPEQSLSGKAAIVTGGSRGIGKAIAEALAGAGASIAIAARGQEGLDAAAEDLRASSTGGGVLSVAADATDAAQVRSLVDRTVEAFGSLDILVNNAGAAPF